LRGCVIPGFARESRNLIAYVGQSAKLQIKTNRFSPVIVIGLGGAKRGERQYEMKKQRRWLDNDAIPPAL